MAIPKDKLLILDLDETLVFASEEPLGRDADFRAGPYHVYKRPHVDPFLAACVDRFEVAVWTSSSSDYAATVVRALFAAPERLAFVWASDRCTQAYDAECSEFYWRKNVRKVRRRGYRLESVIAVDDSPEKWRQSYGNLVLVEPYFGAEEDGELPMLSAYLDTLRAAENVRNVEKRRWKSRIIPYRMAQR